MVKGSRFWIPYFVFRCICRLEGRLAVVGCSSFWARECYERLRAVLACHGQWCSSVAARDLQKKGWGSYGGLL